MGIYSRDYIRETPPGDPYGTSAHLWAIKFLLIANVAVFLLQNASKDTVSTWLELGNDELLGSGQVWRLVTYGFCHSTGTLTHIFFNMLILWMFGRMIEPIYGSREFLAFYLGGIVASGLCHVAAQWVEATSVPVVGASGGVMAVVFLTAMHYPRLKVLLFFVLPIELRWLAVMYAVADVAGMFDDHSAVAHAAHLGGAAFGVAYRHYHWRLSRVWDRAADAVRSWSPRRSRPKVRLYQPSREDLDEQVDAILAKIYEHGESCLTDQEREILKSASRRYKNR